MNPYILTNQKIPDSQKDIEWHKDHVRNFVNLIVKNTFDERKQQQLKCLKSYLCVVDKEKEMANKPITTPYGYSLGLEFISYPLIESMLEQMVGEFMARGIQKKPYVMNKSAKTKKLDEIFNMISEDILRSTNKELEGALGFVPDTENPDKELPPDIESFIQSDFKTISEEVSEAVLNQVLIGKKQIDKINHLFLDFLLYDECIGEVSEEDGRASQINSH